MGLQDDDLAVDSLEGEGEGDLDHDIEDLENPVEEFLDSGEDGGDGYLLLGLIGGEIDLKKFNQIKVMFKKGILKPHLLLKNTTVVGVANTLKKLVYTPYLTRKKLFN